jgi:hypothetical protein
MIDFKSIFNILLIVGVVAGFGFLFYYYYTSDKVKKAVNSVLPFLPAVFSFLAGSVKDKPGVFDAHDGWVLLSRVSGDIKTIISNNANASFEDVQDDVVTVVARELARYRAAGVKNVPDVTDPAIRESVKVVFEQIKRALDENRETHSL